MKGFIVRLKARIKASLEDFEQEGTGVVSDIEAESADNTQADIAAVDEAAAEASEIADSVQEAGDDIDTLEETVTVLEETTDNGGATAAEISVIAPATEAIFAKYGFKPVFNLSVEAYSTETSRLRQTQVSVEGIKDVAETLKNWIIEAFVWLGKTIVQGAMSAYTGIKGLKDKFKKTKADLKEAQAELNKAGLSDKDVQEAVEEIIKSEDTPASVTKAVEVIVESSDAAKEESVKQVEESINNLEELVETAKSVSIEDITADTDLSNAKARKLFKNSFIRCPQLEAKLIKAFGLDESCEWRVVANYGATYAVSGVKWQDSDRKVVDAVYAAFIDSNNASKESFAISNEGVFDTASNAADKLRAGSIKLSQFYDISIMIDKCLAFSVRVEKITNELSKLTFSKIKDSIVNKGREEGESFLKSAVRMIKNFFMGIGKVIMMSIKVITSFFASIYRHSQAYIALQYYVIKNKVSKAS